jgi:hypothetical protein
VAVRCVFPSGDDEDGGVQEWEEVFWALLMACYMARRIHSWSHSGVLMLVSCHVCGEVTPGGGDDVFWVLCMRVYV